MIKNRNQNARYVLLYSVGVRLMLTNQCVDQIKEQEGGRGRGG